MKNYEAIKNLTLEQMANFLNQVFLTGFNYGHQAVVEPDLHDESPFDAGWLRTDVEGGHSLLKDASGEDLILDPLVKIIFRIMEFDVENLPEDISWKPGIVLPKGI